MRPKRHVILYATDLNWGDQVRFILETRMSVNCSETDDLGVVGALLPKADAVIVLGAEGSKDVAEMLARHEHAMIVLKYRDKYLSEWKGSTHFWSDDRTHVSDFLDAIRILLIRQRGPKRRSTDIIWTATDIANA